jgi:hypothetical protein
VREGRGLWTVNGKTFEGGADLRHAYILRRHIGSSCDSILPQVWMRVIVCRHLACFRSRNAAPTESDEDRCPEL